MIVRVSRELGKPSHLHRSAAFALLRSVRVSHERGTTGQTLSQPAPSLQTGPWRRRPTSRVSSPSSTRRIWAAGGWATLSWPARRPPTMAGSRSRTATGDHRLEGHAPRAGRPRRSHVRCETTRVPRRCVLTNYGVCGDAAGASQASLRHPSSFTATSSCRPRCCRAHTTATFTQWIGGNESKRQLHSSPPSRPIQSWPVVVPK